MSGGDYLWKRAPGTAATASGTSEPIDTSNVDYAGLDITVSAITGGTAPTIQFFIDRLGADGIWYAVYTGTALSAPGVVSVDLGLVVAGTGTAHAVFSKTARIRWLFGGTAVPTSVTFSGSLVGRSVR